MTEPSSCLGCGADLNPALVFVDLGAQPLANSLLSRDQLREPEVHYPLRPVICDECLLVQLPTTPAREELFTPDYPFYSGQSQTWVRHCDDYATMAVERFGLDHDSRVLEIGSNDGTLLSAFRDRQIPALGVEPCEQVAMTALSAGLATLIEWWGEKTAEHLIADLIVCNNVLAHVPDLRDFLAGIRTALKPTGTVTFEVAYLGDMMRDGRFDQVYAEHHCYFTLRSITSALRESGLYIYDVERLPVHGGSIRVYAHTGSREFRRDLSQQCDGLRPSDEQAQALHDLDTYREYAERVAQRKRMRTLYGLRDDYELLDDSDDMRRHNGTERIVAYGASAKAAVVLNYYGWGPETIECVIDTTPAKQGKFMPGCRIPILPPSALRGADIVVNFLHNWPEESEANIRREAPDAEIVYV